MFLILYSQILGKNHKTINIPATTHHESDQQTFICYLSKLSSLLVRHLQKPLQCPVRLTRHFRHHFWNRTAAKQAANRERFHKIEVVNFKLQTFFTSTDVFHKTLETSTQIVVYFREAIFNIFS